MNCEACLVVEDVEGVTVAEESIATTHKNITVDSAPHYERLKEKISSFANLRFLQYCSTSSLRNEFILFLSGSRGPGGAGVYIGLAALMVV